MNAVEAIWRNAMKKALAFFALSAIFCPASASVYIDLSSRTAKGVNDGKPIVIITRDSVTVKLPLEEASTPEGTENMSANEELIEGIEDDDFEAISTVFNQAVENGFAIESSNQTFSPGSETSNLPVILNSISRKNLNETTDRYLNMIFTEDEFIPAKPAKTIPGTASYYVEGTPGKVKCKNSGGYNCYSGICVNQAVTTECKTVGGSPGYWVPAQPPQYIPAVPAKTITHQRDLTVDCKDQTYDIKNDGKGWEKYWQNPIITMIAEETCPAIRSYPLR